MSSKPWEVQVFPKSLTELSFELRESFAELLSEHCMSDTLFFINSYITDNPEDNTRVDGINQFKVISRVIQDAGFEPSTPPTKYTYREDPFEWLGHKFPFFKIPDTVAPFVSKLKSNCGECDPAEDNCDKCDIDFYPVMKSNYLAYRVIEFIRE